MNKNLKTILLIVLVIGVLLVAAFATGKKSVESITMEDYSKISKESGFVYYGKSSDMDTLKDLANDANIQINFLDSKKEENKDLKEGTLYQYKKGKEVYKYTGSLTDYKGKESLMKANIIPRTYLTVNLKEYKEIMKSDGYHFMFIGRETCSYCTKFKDSIKEAMKDYDFMVYYIDTDTFGSEEEFNELIATDSYMSEEEWGTPLNLLYKDGKRINVLNGYVDADELVKFLKNNKVI